MRFNALCIIGAHHAILTLIIIGLMLVSIPFGAYVVFGVQYDDIDTAIEQIGITLVGFRFALPLDTTLGYVFGVLWCTYAVMVGIAITGPRMHIIRAIKNLVSGSGNESWLYQNHMLSVVSWFTILILASTMIDIVQVNAGVQIIPPDYGGDLNRFYDATKAPIIEEIGFRVLLIGAPLAGLYMFRQSPTRTLNSLVHPYSVHGTHSIRIALGLVVVSAVFFGVLHIVGDDSWSAGKATQAGVAGIILGWVYYRHGLLAAILVHWATNYFVLAFLYFFATIADTTLSNIFAHTASSVLEILLIVSGIVSTIFLVMGRKKTHLDTKSVL